MPLDQSCLKREGFTLSFLSPDLKLTCTFYTSCLRNTFPRSFTASNHSFEEGKILLYIFERLLF